MEIIKLPSDTMWKKRYIVSLNTREKGDIVDGYLSAVDIELVRNKYRHIGTVRNEEGKIVVYVIPRFRAGENESKKCAKLILADLKS